MRDLVRDDGTAVAKYGARALHEFMYEIITQKIREFEAEGGQLHPVLHSAMLVKRLWLDGKLTTKAMEHNEGILGGIAKREDLGPLFWPVTFATRSERKRTDWHPVAAAAWYCAVGCADYDPIMAQMGEPYPPGGESRYRAIEEVFNRVIEEHKAERAQFLAEVME